MKQVNAVYMIILLTNTLMACGQTESDRTKLGRSHAEQELRAALDDDSQPNVIDHKSAIIRDSATAISIAESMLFNIYGKDNITAQRPYETYLIDDHWVISGTLPKDHIGGTFLIIIDSRDGRVIKITHGK